MTIEIHQCSRTAKDKPIRLALCPNPDGRNRVTLHLVDEYGEPLSSGSRLVTISKNGIYLHRDVNVAGGIKKSTTGRLYMLSAIPSGA